MDRLIFLYFAFFPFGKLLGIIPDLVIFLLLILNFKKFKTNNFIFVCLFSLLFSLSFFKFSQIFIGLLYFLRLSSYFSLIQIVHERFGMKKHKRELIFNSLIVIGTFIAAFGFVQYSIFPDLRTLKIFGWDDHYFRLVSTFLDPAFTGILLVLTQILLIIKFVNKKEKKYLLLNIFVIIATLLTYSRSSYLALFFALTFLFWKFRNKFILFLGILFLLFVPLLPRPGGEGVNLKRTYTIVDKFVNYKDSITLIKKSPLFGIGFNNVCVATTNNFTSHACNGLDNSILFIFATTGVVGLIIFLPFILGIVNNTTQNKYGIALTASFIAIFAHGMFTETFFYSFILGWIAILIGISRKTIKD